MLASTTTGIRLVTVQTIKALSLLGNPKLQLKKQASNCAWFLARGGHLQRYCQHLLFFLDPNNRDRIRHH